MRTPPYSLLLKLVLASIAGPAIGATSLTLINATSNNPQPLSAVSISGSTIIENSIVYLGATGQLLNVRANFGAVGSVKFGYDGNPNHRVETTAPYAFASDTNGDYHNWTPTLGPHTITATSYSGAGATGSVLETVTVRFSVVAGLPPAAPVGPVVSSLDLINANSNLPQALSGVSGQSSDLLDGAVIDLAKVGQTLNIRANVSGANSVKFGYDGNANYRTEGTAPFAFASDSAGDYYSWTPTLGSHTLTATAFSGTSAGAVKVVRFSVVNTSTTTPTPPPPTSGTPASTAEPAYYDGPIVITRGGTYSGNWRSMDMNVPAVTVNTAEAVTIKNCHVAGNADLIFTPWANVNLTVRNCSFHGKPPSIAGRSRGKAINAQRYKNLLIENNYFENTGAAIFTNEYAGNGTTSETLTIRYNRVRNLNGGWNDGTGKTWIQFVQCANYIQPQGNPRGASISWNEVINEPGKSISEDLINFYKAGGRADSRFKVHNNFLRGSYPNHTYASGSGIQIDGDDHNKTAHIDVYENTVLNTLNGGMGMAAGSNVRMFNNRIISSAKYADGTWIPGSYAGVWIFDYYGTRAVGTMQNNIIENNVIGWAQVYSTSMTPYQYRLDYNPNNNLGGGIRNNIHLPNVPITLATEDAEYQTFLNKVGANNINLGPMQE